MVFSNTEVFNFEGAIRGMRNPLASWGKSDSEFGICHLNEVNTAIDKFKYKHSISTEDHGYYVHEIAGIDGHWKYNLGALDAKTYPEVKPNYRYPDENHWINYALIGPNDLDLMKRLIKAGPSHRKFLRQIFVSVDITAPLYWWKEFDTYKVGTTANSTSTMHKLASTPITLKCFEIDDYTILNDEMLKVPSEGGCCHELFTFNEGVDLFIQMLENLRLKYLETKDKRYWKELVRWLPNGWLQTRTVTLTYENILSMLHQRANHKLNEWSGIDDASKEYFCKWAWNLPYVKYLFADVIEKKDRWEE